MLLPYIDYLLSREIDGLRLLSMTVEDLPTLLHVDKLGHQELLMGSIDLLRDIVSLKTKKNKRNRSCRSVFLSMLTYGFSEYLKFLSFGK